MLLAVFRDAHSNVGSLRARKAVPAAPGWSDATIRFPPPPL
jgi:hypothetical protein